MLKLQEKIWDSSFKDMLDTKPLILIERYKTYLQI